MDTQPDLPRAGVPATAGIGTLAGVFSGLFGVGGGTVMVPLLIRLRGLDARRATATSLGAIVIISAAGVLAQAPYGTVHPRQALLLGLPALFGAWSGTTLQQRISLRTVSVLFGAMLLAVAVSLVVVPTGQEASARALSAPVIGIALLLGYAAGVLSGLLGVGGGIVFVPALVYALGLGHVDAEATSLLAILPSSALGAWRQRRFGNLELRTALLLGILAVPGAYGGVALANALPVEVLRLGFAALLVYVGVRFLRR